MGQRVELCSFCTFASNHTTVNTRYLCCTVHTHLLTPRSRVLLEKLAGSQLVKKFPAFYRARMFTAAFASALHLSLSCARSIQSIPPQPTSWGSILILSSHLRLGFPSGLLYISTGLENFKEFSFSNNGTCKLLWSTLVCVCVCVCVCVRFQRNHSIQL